MSIRNPITHVITKKLTVTTMPVYERNILSMCINNHILSAGSLQVCILSESFHYMKINLFGVLVHKYKLPCMISFTDYHKSYKSYDGNYYTYPHREHQIKRFEQPSFIQTYNRGTVFHDIILTTHFRKANSYLMLVAILW